jgi:hypothetical protein
MRALEIAARVVPVASVPLDVPVLTDTALLLSLLWHFSGPRRKLG